MRTVFINGRFLARRVTGVQRYATEVVRALDELLEAGDSGFPPFVLAAPSDARHDLELRNIEQRRVGNRTGHIWEQVDLAAHARRGVLVSLASTGPARHSRHIVTIHDAGVFANPGNFSFAFRIWYRALFSQLRRSVRTFLTVSEFSRGELARYCRIPEERILITYNGVDHVQRCDRDETFLAREDIAPGYVLCVGADNPNKNTSLVLEALRILDDPRLSLVSVGVENPRIFKPSSNHAYARHRRVGNVTDGALRALFAGALCLAFPSLYEGFGIPPLEAMANGCPAVVSRIPALQESCGDAALYCDPRDPGELAGHIRALRDDAALRARVRAAGLARAARFRWSDGARVVLELAASLAGSPRESVLSTLAPGAGQKR